MSEDKCCGTVGDEQKISEYETIKIEKTKRICPLCENYSEKHTSKPVVVMTCEGGCLRGEIARQAANLICHKLAPEKTVRICLGGAFTKDTGQRNLVRNASRLIALEGCFIQCSSRMMKGVIPGLRPEVIIATKFYDLDKNLFGIEEMAEDEIKIRAQEVAKKVVEKL